MHNFESIMAGFTTEGGHWNYSRCTKCGVVTANYQHGDFTSQTELENNISSVIPCELEEDEIIIARAEAEIAKSFRGMF